MKKQKRILIFIISLFTALTILVGCADGYQEPEVTREIESLDDAPPIEDIPDKSVDDIEEGETDSVEAPDTSSTDQEIPATPVTDIEEVVEHDSSADMSDLTKYDDESINQVAAFNVGRYGYESLSADEKRVYNQIYLTLDEMGSNTSIDTLDSELLKQIFKKVMADHPEIFWVNGYTYTNYEVNDVLQAVGISGNYTYNQESRKSKQSGIDSYVNTCLASAPAGDDYTKIKYVYEYLISHTDYDTLASDNQNICSVFINGKSVCQGYAKATQYLLGKMGIKCILVSGTTNTGEPHAWNVVCSDGSFYQIDTTWGDASYKDMKDGTTAPSINYDYLCVPASDIYKTHTPDNTYDLPNCISMKDNYYVREGAYFTSVDGTQLASLFAGAIAQGKSFVSIKASDASVYGALKQYLISDQHVFEYLGASNSSVSYWENGESNSISFKLST